MCRLLGYAAASPTSLRAVVGDTQLALFTALSRVHGDGWGASWWPGPRGAPPAAGPPVHLRSTRAAAEDPDFAAMAERTTGAAAIVHLRWATAGFAVDTVNTHPFSAEDMSFAHNGSITPTTALDGLLAPATRDGLIGDTDSERYFALVRQEHANRPGAPAAAARAAGALRRHYPHASLNALLLTRHELVVVHANSAHGAPVGPMPGWPGGPPPDHFTDYFLMRWLRRGDGSLVFASSGLDAQGWAPLPAESVTTVDLATLQMRHLPISTRGVPELVA